MLSLLDNEIKINLRIDNGLTTAIMVRLDDTVESLYQKVDKLLKTQSKYNHCKSNYVKMDYTLSYFKAPKTVFLTREENSLRSWGIEGVSYIESSKVTATVVIVCFTNNMKFKLSMDVSNFDIRDLKKFLGEKIGLPCTVLYLKKNKELREQDQDDYIEINEKSYINDENNELEDELLSVAYHSLPKYNNIYVKFDGVIQNEKIILSLLDSKNERNEVFDIKLINQNEEESDIHKYNKNTKKIVHKDITINSSSNFLLAGAIAGSTFSNYLILSHRYHHPETVKFGLFAIVGISSVVYGSLLVASKLQKHQGQHSSLSETAKFVLVGAAAGSVFTCTLELLKSYFYFNYSKEILAMMEVGDMKVMNKLI